MSDLAQDLTTAAKQITPPAAVAGASVLAQANGLTLQEWVFVLTILYLLAQLLYLLWKFGRDVIREWRHARRSPGRTPQDE